MQKPLATFVAGLLAGAVVVGGVGVVSAVTGTDTPIVACADKKTGAMRYSAKGKCKKSERKLSLQAPISLAASQVAGPKGDTGATGSAGAKGDTGSTGPQGATGPAGTGLNTVPVAFGSKTLIQTEPIGCCDYGNNNLFLHARFSNRTGSALDFPDVQSDSHQLWIEYFDANGEPLTCGESCIYAPENVLTFLSPPMSCPVSQFDDLLYEIGLGNVHADRPEGARYFAIQFRIFTDTFGATRLSDEVPIIDFAVTPTDAFDLSVLSTDAPVTMAC